MLKFSDSDRVETEGSSELFETCQFLLPINAEKLPDD